MRDVARLADVSPSTVSAVLNGTPLVSQERTERVRHAIKALGFEPNHVARSLKTGRTNTVGVVIPDITNSFYPVLLRGIEDAARERLYTVLFCNSNEDVKQEQSLLRVLSSRRVDGILLTCSAPPAASGALVFKNCPLVFVDRVPPSVTSCAITTDNVHAGALAARHLLELGHRHIGLLGGRLDISTHSDRLVGFREAMDAAGVSILPKYVQECDMHMDSAYRSAKGLLALEPRPTAIIASNQNLLLGLLRATHEANLRYPSQLSVVTFDDSSWSEHLGPALTTVAQPTYQMGKCAFEILFRRMRPDLNEEHLSDDSIKLLKAELKVRESTGPPFE